MFASSYLVLYTRRAKRDGKYPVKVRVVYQGLHHDYPIGLDLMQAEFDGATVERPRAPFKEIAAELTFQKNKAQSIIKDLKVFTFQKFEDAFYGRIKDASDLFPYFDEYIKALEKEERIKTASSYTTTRNSFKSFKSRISLYDITPSFLQNYQQEMIKKGASTTTVGIYTRSLRSVYNYAISLGVIKRDENYPFGKRKFVIPASRNIKKALSVNEVAAIHSYQTIPFTPEDKAKDFWIFSYLCNGINFKDIALLKNKNIDGTMLRFIREKTKNTTQGNQNTISCYLSEPALRIIEKWRTKDKRPDAYLFSILDENDDAQTRVKKVAQFIKNTNKYMKRISISAGVSREATTYYSRHSAATILKRSGASIQQIQEALGHQSSATTQKYLDSFDDDSKKELANSLGIIFK